MPIDPVSKTPQQFQQVRSDFQSLQQALKAGNLAGAQKAYASLQSDSANGPQPPAGSAAANYIEELGDALDAGDLSGAQDAFSSLQTEFQNARQARGPHGPPPDGGGDKDSSNSDNSQKTIASQVATTNANGTVTVTITYTDGSTSTKNEPNPNPLVSGNAQPSNSRALSVLLDAQQQANS